MSPRWSDYVLCRDQEVEEAWRAAATAKRTFFIAGEGFDPRAHLALERVLASDACDAITLVTVAPGGAARVGSETGRRARVNGERFAALATERGLRHVQLAYPKVEEARSAGAQLARNLHRRAVVESGAHVLIDVSSMPAGIFFPLIASFIRAADAGLFKGDLQVVVAENPALDGRILGEGREDAGPLRGFTFGLDLAAAAARPRIWAPVLGEKTAAQLELLFQRLNPQEVCPILPFPARDPRRADALVLEHREFLFDRIKVETGNLIYAHESNPFDLYRALAQLNERYASALAPLGKTQLVVSTHASKTLSLGVMLASYEFELSFVTAGSSRFRIEDADTIDYLVDKSELLCLWLLGEPTQ